VTPAALRFLCPLCFEFVRPSFDEPTDGDLEHRRIRIRFACTRRTHYRRPFHYVVGMQRYDAARRSAAWYGRRELVLGEDL
jgi:hypothetical protein